MKKNIIIFCLLAFIVLVISLFFIPREKSLIPIKSLDVSNFITIDYLNDLDGRGEIEVSINSEELYNELIKISSKNTSHDLLRALSSELEYNIIGNNGMLKNGDKVTLSLSMGVIGEYGLSSDEFEDIFGIKIVGTNVEYTVSELKQDTNVYIDLWNYYEMNISGLSGSGVAYAKRLFTDPLVFDNYDGSAQLIIYPDDEENVIIVELKRGSDYLLYKEVALYCPLTTSSWFFYETKNISIGDYLKYYVSYIDESILQDNGFVLITTRENHLVTDNDLGVLLSLSASDFIEQYGVESMDLARTLIKESLSESEAETVNIEKVFLRTSKNDPYSHECYAIFSYFNDSSNERFGYAILGSMFIDPKTNKLDCNEITVETTSWWSSFKSYDEAYDEISDELEDSYYVYTELEIIK